MSTTAAGILDAKTVKKWAKANEKLFKALQKQLDKADDVDVVIRELDVSEPSVRAFRNLARRLKRELPTAGRLRQRLLREAKGEVKRYGKILEQL